MPPKSRLLPKAFPETIYFPGNAAEKPPFAEKLSRNNLFPEK
jgi:hypothetical protein